MLDAKCLIMELQELRQELDGVYWDEHELLLAKERIEGANEMLDEVIKLVSKFSDKSKNCPECRHLYKCVGELYKSVSR